jgi:hypothetical protein
VDGTLSFVFAVGRGDADKFTAERYYGVTEDGDIFEDIP